MFLAILRVSLKIMAVMSVALTLQAQIPSPPSLERIGGRKISDIDLMNDHGQTLHLSDLSRDSLIVEPVFASCSSVCGLGASVLHAGITASSTSGKPPQVLIFSFDPDDKLEDLVQFSKRHGLPTNWILAKASQEATRKLLEELDFRFVTLGRRAFDHPSAAILLGAGLTVQRVFNPLNKDSWPKRWHMTSSEAWIVDHLGTVLAVLMVGLLISGWLTAFLFFRSRKIYVSDSSQPGSGAEQLKI